MPGPYLKAAVLCENAIEDKQGVLSLIRIVDRTILGARGPEVPDEMPSFKQRIFVVLMFVSGDARGTHQCSIVLQKPDGLRQLINSGTVLLEGDDRGANVIIEMNLDVELEGLHWYEVRLGNQISTQIPWRVVYQRQIQTLPSP